MPGRPLLISVVLRVCRHGAAGYLLTLSLRLAALQGASVRVGATPRPPYLGSGTRSVARVIQKAPATNRTLMVTMQGQSWVQPVLACSFRLGVARSHITSRRMPVATVLKGASVDDGAPPHHLCLGSGIRSVVAAPRPALAISSIAQVWMWVLSWQQLPGIHAFRHGAVGFQSRFEKLPAVGVPRGASVRVGATIGLPCFGNGTPSAALAVCKTLAIRSDVTISTFRCQWLQSAWRSTFRHGADGSRRSSGRMLVMGAPRHAVVRVGVTPHPRFPRSLIRSAAVAFRLVSTTSPIVMLTMQVRCHQKRVLARPFRRGAAGSRWTFQRMLATASPMVARVRVGARPQPIFLESGTQGVVAAARRTSRHLADLQACLEPQTITCLPSSLAAGRVVPHGAIFCLRQSKRTAPIALQTGASVRAGADHRLWEHGSGIRHAALVT
mmetsp:Transcript_95114/g.248118  ORF Transcript_95114/g.248118 Transcript_95114/m.248118 type:complete len:440 (-) Transcript_95114:157-1476(-)